MLVNLNELSPRQLDAVLEYTLALAFVQGRFISPCGDGSATANHWTTVPGHIMMLVEDYIHSLENPRLGEWSATADGHSATATTLGEAVVKAVLLSLGNGEVFVQIPDEAYQSHS
jgi:hypothetical protein